METAALACLAFLAAAPMTAPSAPASQEPAAQPGWGYQGSQRAGGSPGYGYGASGQTPHRVTGADPAMSYDTPPGVGYNTGGGELSRRASQQAAVAGEHHIHMAGPTAAQAVGAGGGPPITQGEQPGYVQAKFVTPYGNSVVMHHYGPGYPPPMGTPGTGPNDGNATGYNAYTSSVAGDPGLVNWGLTPAYTAEEIRNGVWFGPGGNGTVAGNPDMVNWGLVPAATRAEWGNGIWFSNASSDSSGNPVPYVGTFND